MNKVGINLSDKLADGLLADVVNCRICIYSAQKQCVQARPGLPVILFLVKINFYIDTYIRVLATIISTIIGQEKENSSFKTH